jgi:hypothetical protein
VFVQALGVAALAVGLGGSAPGCQQSPVAVSRSEQIVPSLALPPEAVALDSNNNLDVAEHDGELYIAFRTAPTHFASAETRLHVLSSPNGDLWRHEATFALGTDLREPRFLAWDGRLFLYFAVLGANPLDFEPQGMRFSRFEEPGRWSAPEPVYEAGFIPWRAKVLGGVPYLIGYVGGENIYDPQREPIRIHFLTTRDGLAWEPVVPGRPVVQIGGGSETDFVFLEDGALVAVQRNEKGDELGWGSKICRAEPGALGDWLCVGDKRKFDSPLLFRQGREVWLVARRNLNGTGNYDLELRDLSPEEQTRRYLVDYSLHRKRCSLWKVDPDLLSVEFVQDLPSKGDTCFPSMLRVTPQSVELYNYSSPVDGADLPWIGGQLQETRIYRMLLTFRE